MSDGREPQGVIAIMTQPDGHVIATAADFDRSGYGGFKLWQAQQIRARDAVKGKAVRAYCSDILFNSLERYTIEKIAEDLLSRKGGHKITIRAIGYPSEVSREVERRD